MITLTRADWRKLLLPGAAGLALLACGGALVAFAGQSQRDARQSLAAAQAERVQNKERLSRIAEEEREVREKIEVYQELLRLNSEVLLGAFSMDGRDIFFSHSFLGRRLRPEQLIASLDTVATISDEYDEQLVEAYGGETALERLRGNANRSRSLDRLSTN